jgi:hypothetical protein
MMISPAGPVTEKDRALRPRKNCKVQTRSVVREGARHAQTRNCLKITIGKIRTTGGWSKAVVWQGHTYRLTVDRNAIFTLTWAGVMYGGGLEYLHRSPSNFQRRRKGNPVPGSIRAPLCPWRVYIRGLHLPGWGRLKCASKVWSRLLRGLDPRPPTSRTSELDTRLLVRDVAAS